MTVSYKKSGAGGAAYYTDCMSADGSKSVDDYYSGSSKEPPGVWYVGPDTSESRISNLGIEDRAAFNSTEDREDVERFHHLANGFHPEDGYGLVQNAGADSRIAFHDFTMSAPKSVSVVWSQADPDLKSQIEAAQSDSARAFLDFMSGHSMTRMGKAGFVKVPAPLRGALFGHGSSREDDPQLHTHAVMMNIVERPDGKTGALETLEMMRWTGAAASLYHANLAWRMRELGFEIERKDRLFEIGRVRLDVMKAFSRRREQIVRAAEKRQAELGMTPDAAAASRELLAAVAIESRNSKSELTREQLQAQWTKRGVELGFTQAQVQSLLITAEPLKVLSVERLYGEAVQAVDDLTDVSAVFGEPALLTAVASHLVGRASPQQIQATMSELKDRHLLMSRGATKAEDRFTTRERLALEQRMVLLAKRADPSHMLTGFTLPKSLDTEQSAAAHKVCTDPNAVTVVEGADGEGKIFTMSAVARTYEVFGYKVTGLASSGAAALDLKESVKLEEGQAITGWVNGVRDGSISLSDKSLLIMDEAGTVGARDMKNVLELANEHRAKVVVYGDTLQKKAVGAGDSLRVIINKIGTTRIDSVRPQHSAEQRQAVDNFFAGQAGDGLAPYLMSSSVCIERSEQQTHAVMVKRWSASRHAHGGQHLMLASDRKSVAELNRLAHEARKAAGEIQDGLSVENMDCTEVEFSVGDEVQLRKNDRSQRVFSRTSGTVTKIEDRVLTIKTQSGLIDVDVDSEQWQHRESGKLALQHAYATTVYASQGLTVNRAFVKDSTGLDRASAGVAMSRHRENCEVFVDAQARHEARMRVTPSNEWKPLSSYLDSECIDDLIHSWSREREKDSTLDHTNWTSPAGGAVNVRLQAEIAAMKSSVQRARAGIELIGQMSKHGMPLKLLPFQQQPGYLLPEPQQSCDVIEAGTQRLLDDGVHEQSIREAFESGVLRFTNTGDAVFCGRREDGGLASTVIEHPGSGDSPLEAQPLLRDRFAPVLRADADRVDVVRTGREALHLRSLQLRQEEPLSTVVVSQGRDDRLGLPHLRKVLDEARHVERLDQCQTQAGQESPVVQANQQLAEEAARRAQEQQRESYRHR